jgi:hypothetical protein
LVWEQLDSDKVRQLVESQEKCADDLVWLDQYNALVREIAAELGVPQDRVSAVVFAGPPLSVIRATLNVRNVTPGSVCSVVRDLFGNPFNRPEINPLWLQANDGRVSKLAHRIYDESAFDGLPILADALLEIGCDDESLIVHCQSSDRHFRGCWAIDALLGKTDDEPDQTAWMRRRAERAKKKLPAPQSDLDGGEPKKYEE